MASYPVFVSEVHSLIVSGGGPDTVPIPTTAKRVMIAGMYAGGALVADLNAVIVRVAPPDVGPLFFGTMPLGAMMDIPDHCSGGNAPDAITVSNGGAGDVTYWLRFYT